MNRSLVAAAFACCLLALPSSASAATGSNIGKDFPEPPAPITVLKPDNSSTGTSSSGVTTLATPIGPRRYTLSTTGGWAPIRNDRQSLVIGNGRNGWTFDASLDDNGYYGGWIYGAHDYCGWVQTGNITSQTGTPALHCRDNDGRLAPNRFAGLINCDSCNGPTGIPLPTTLTGYRNIRPWSSNRGPVDTSGSGTITWNPSSTAGWRYVTPDNQWVLIADGALPGGANGVFVARSQVDPGDPNRAMSGLCRSSDPGPLRPASSSHSDWPNVCTNN